MTDRERLRQDCSQIIAPLRKPIYVLTRSANKWDRTAVEKWLRILRLACTEVAGNITEYLHDQREEYYL